MIILEQRAHKNYEEEHGARKKFMSKSKDKNEKGAKREKGH